MKLDALLNQISIDLPQDSPIRQIGDSSIHFGGPVQIDRGFVLHQPVGQWQSTIAINGDTALTTSKDILEAAARGEGPDKLLVTLGYAGWSAGQLEQELAQNAWLTVAAQDMVIFDMPDEKKRDAAMELLGFNLASLADEAGHA
jgi:putative transcriptional regulator